MKKREKHDRSRRASVSAFPVSDVSRCLEEKRGADAVRLLSRWNADGADPKALELAARALYMRGLQGYSAGLPLNSIIADLSLASRYLPGSPQIWFHLGLAYCKAGLHSKATRALRTAVDLRPGEPRYSYHLAWATVASNSATAGEWIARLDLSARETRFLRAISEPQANSEQIPSDPGTEFLLLRALQLAGTSPGASLLRQAAADDPDNPVVVLALGNLELQEGNRLGALECLEKALQAGVDMPELRQSLGRLYLWRGAEAIRVVNEEGGRADLDRALALAPDLAPCVGRLKERAFAARATRFASEGNLAAAVPLWRDLADKPAFRLPALHNLALAYERLDDPEKASLFWQRWLRALREQAPVRPELAVEIWRHAGQCLLKAGRENEAAAAFESLLREAPQDEDAHDQLVHFSMETENWDDAIRHILFLQPRRPGSSTLLTQLGLARLMKDDLEGAIEAWNRALELEPANRAAQSYLLEAFERRLATMSPKQYGVEGLRLIHELIARLRNHYAPHLVLAKYFFSFNDRKHAREAVELALQTEPQNPYSWLNALHLLLDSGTKGDCKQMSHRLLKVFSASPEQQVRAGALLLDHGREGLAEEHFAAALAASTDGKIPLSVAEVCVESEHYDQAERYARLALEREGGSAAAHAIMAETFLMRDEVAEAQRHLEIALSQAKHDTDARLLDELREMAQALDFAKTLRLFAPPRSSR